MAIAALLVMSAGAWPQEPGTEEPAASDMPEGCKSVVQVECMQPGQQATEPATPVDARKAATQRKLQERRLRQAQAQAGLNAVEVTAERPTDLAPDAWDSFRQSVSSAAVDDCGRHTLPEAQGLLRAPLLLQSAATGKCR